MAKEMGESFTKQELSSFLARYDLDGDGQVNFSDFKDAILCGKYK